METNVVNYFEYGEGLGDSLGNAISGTMSGLAESFNGNLSSDILEALAIVAGVFLVLAGFWIVVRNLIRAANMTGRRR